MGLFKFIKSVGEKIFGASEAQAAPADSLAKEVAKHGLNVDGHDIQVSGNKITVGRLHNQYRGSREDHPGLGQHAGVSEVESKLIVAQEVPAAVMYEVKKGDTLWKIAETHYGKGKGGKYEGISKPTSRCSATRTRSIRARSCGFRARLSGPILAGSKAGHCPAFFMRDGAEAIPRKFTVDPFEALTPAVGPSIRRARLGESS